MFNKIRGRLAKFYPKTKTFIRKRPLTAFFVTLLALFLVILLGRFLTPPVKEVSRPELVKQVKVLSVGETPRVKTVAQVEKDGVIVISALTPGVVSQIHVSEGDQILRGKTLVSLSSNYQGGNVASLSRQIASKQYQNINDTFDTQKEIIKKQKELAEKSSENTEELRKISVSTNDDTKSLLTLNEDLLSQVNTQLNNLISSNSSGSNDATILQTRQSKAQLQQGINSLKSAIRNADFATSTDNSPTEIANITREVTIKQLELQEKALTLNKEISRLQLNLAAVSEAMMFPSSPCAGSVQKVHVSVGQQVSPGMPLVTIYAPAGNVRVVAKVAANVAKQISKLEMAHLLIDGQDIVGTPDFVSSEATDGRLYQVVFNIPDYLHKNLTDGEFISVELPISADTTSGAFPFVPLDSVFQTQDTAYVYVAEGDIAKSRTVTLGEVIGQDVEIKDGLKDGDKIILNRNILADDKIDIQ